MYYVYFTGSDFQKMLVLVLLCLRNQEKLVLRNQEVRNIKTETAVINPDCHQPPLPQRCISYVVCAEMLIVLLALIPLHAVSILLTAQGKISAVHCLYC